jgi:hypothetical protein
VTGRQSQPVLRRHQLWRRALQTAQGSNQQGFNFAKPTLNTAPARNTASAAYPVADRAGPAWSDAGGGLAD